MNYRHRGLVITIRTLLGLLFVFSGVTGLLAGSSMEGVPPQMVAISQALWSSGIFHMIKITEIVAGLMLLFGFLPALAVLFVAPIAVGIIVVDSLLMPNYVFVGIVVALLTAYLGYAYWDKYRGLFQRN
mgnify:CR=1 FL=1